MSSILSRIMQTLDIGQMWMDRRTRTAVKLAGIDMVGEGKDSMDIVHTIDPDGVRRSMNFGQFFRNHVYLPESYGWSFNDNRN